MKIKIFIILATIYVLLFGYSCSKTNVNPNIPRVVINVTVEPNSTMYQELNTPGGWLYLEEQPGIYIPIGSAGVIVYRVTMTEFKAYERQPPNFPFECCDDNGLNCSKLVVGGNYPFAKDPCNDNLYQLLDGQLFVGEGQFPLIEYSAMYDGYQLHVYN